MLCEVSKCPEEAEVGLSRCGFHESCRRSASRATTKEGGAGMVDHSTEEMEASEDRKVVDRMVSLSQPDGPRPGNGTVPVRMVDLWRMAREIVALRKV